MDAGLGGPAAGLGLGTLANGLVEFLLRHNTLAGELAQPVHVRGGPLQACLTAVQLSLGLVQLGPVRPRVDLEQQIALLHGRSVAESNLVQVAADTARTSMVIEPRCGR